MASIDKMIARRDQSNKLSELTIVATAISYRIVQNGKEIYTPRNVDAVMMGDMVGIVGNVPCFNMVRFVDRFDKRRARDVSPATLYGPATLELLNAAGEVVGRIGIATRHDVACHPRCETLAV